VAERAADAPLPQVEGGAFLVRGAPLAALIREQVRAALAESGVVPCLVNVVVGAQPASISYLDAIDAAASKLGITSRRIELPAGADQATIVAPSRARARTPPCTASWCRLRCRAA
jgi:methylenetetrahydrofolate dehydrogenase (NADP+) / methenyltetrahydrofolate cyclohydrolase